MTVSVISPQVADLVPIEHESADRLVQTWVLALPARRAGVFRLDQTLGIAPVLGLRQAKRIRPVDRLALAADHLLYGLVLSGTRPVTRNRTARASHDRKRP
jgi:hypothetical protein